MKKTFWGISLALLSLGATVAPVAAQEAQEAPVAYAVDPADRYTAQFVTRAYVAILGRQPEQVGLEFWIDDYENRGPRGIIDFFLQSREFKGNPLTFEEIYENLFFREIEPRGKQFWYNRVVGWGMGRSVTWIINSKEALIVHQDGQPPVWPAVDDCDKPFNYCPFDD